MLIVKKKHFNSKTQKHKENNGNVVKEYELIEPEVGGIAYRLDKVIKDWRNNFFIH